MAKVVNFDLSGADEEVWEQSDGNLSEPPKPGVYKARIREINPGYSKDDDGQPDKSRPRLEVIYEIIGDADGDEDGLDELGHEGGSCKGAWIWDYVSFSKAAEWKQAQFFKTLGVANPKKNKGKFDAEKFEGKKEVRIRVKTGTNLDGDYRPNVGATWPWEDTDTGSDDIDDELDDELDEDEGPYDEADLKAKDLSEIKEIAEELGVDVAKGKKKNTYIKEILEAQDEDDDDDLDDDDDDMDLDDDDDEMEDEDDLPSAEEIREMDPKGLKELAKEHGVSLKGMKKKQAQETLIEELGIEDDDDVPF